MLSIITICLNNVTGVRETLESVIGQKTDEIEYIVIDGGSKDGTLEVIRKYLPSIDVFVSEKDNGIYDAINKGIKCSKGTLIGLMHSGDHFFPGVLSKVLDIHRSFPNEILYGCMKATRKGRFDQVFGWNHENLTEKMIPHLAAFVPAIIYKTYGLYDLDFSIAADYEAFLRYYTHGVQFRFIDLLVCDFNLEGISETDPRTKAEVLHIKKKYSLLRPEKPLRRVFRLLRQILSPVLKRI